ncbi:hypothetical protein J6590_051547 [Homalodisca vitripennis]|nr:hypothetical protein J6590_051547 [Homalodisca vitripennis]
MYPTLRSMFGESDYSQGVNYKHHTHLRISSGDNIQNTATLLCRCGSILSSSECFRRGRKRAKGEPGLARSAVILARVQPARRGAAFRGNEKHPRALSALPPGQHIRPAGWSDGTRRAQDGHHTTRPRTATLPYPALPCPVCPCSNQCHPVRPSDIVLYVHSGQALAMADCNPYNKTDVVKRNK